MQSQKFRVLYMLYHCTSCIYHHYRSRGEPLARPGKRVGPDRASVLPTLCLACNSGQLGHGDARVASQVVTHDHAILHHQRDSLSVAHLSRPVLHPSPLRQDSR